MDFDRLLSQTDVSGQKEAVGLAIYYLEEFEGNDEVTVSAIKQLIRGSRSSISPSSVSTYRSRLEDDGYLTNGHDSYKLSMEGLEYFSDLVPADLIDSPRSDQFIDTDIATGDEFYEQLVEDINECYRVRVNDAVLVLTRKLFENLIHDILYLKYSGQNLQMYFNPEMGQHHGLKELKKNLRNNVQELREHSRDINESVVDVLDEFKNDGDASAHSIIVGVSDEEIESMASDATMLTNVLYDLLEGIRIANQNQEP